MITREMMDNIQKDRKLEVLVQIREALLRIEDRLANLMIMVSPGGEAEKGAEDK